MNAQAEPTGDAPPMTPEFTTELTGASPVGSSDLLAQAVDACREAWSAFENGKRKHHRDALTGRCILGCQACAVEKLKAVLRANDKLRHDA